LQPLLQPWLMTRADQGRHNSHQEGGCNLSSVTQIHAGSKRTCIPSLQSVCQESSSSICQR
jgi:hypothetical protein